MGILHSLSYNLGRYRRTPAKYWRLVFWKDLLYLWGYVRAFFKAFQKPKLVHTKASIDRAYPLQIVSESEILTHIKNTRRVQQEDTSHAV